MIQRPSGHLQNPSNTTIPNLPTGGLPDELFNPPPPAYRPDVTKKAEWRMSPEDYDKMVSNMHGFHLPGPQEAVAYLPPRYDLKRMQLPELRATHIAIVNNLRAAVEEVRKGQALDKYLKLKMASAVPVDCVALTEMADVDTVTTVMKSMMISPPPADVGPPRNISAPRLEVRPILPPYNPFEIGVNYEMLSTPSPSPRKRKRGDTSL